MCKFRVEKDELEIIVKDVLSTAEVCRRLNIRPVGGNYKTLKKYYKLYDIDITHFTGQGWNVGLRYKNFSKTCTLEEIMVENSTYTSTSGLKKKLINEGLKENKCEECKITEWNNKKITFHLDHINGNNMDNRLENLRILCPNCHSQTETYCGNNMNKSSKSEYRNEKYLNRSELEDVIKEDVIKEVKVRIKKVKICSCGIEIRKTSNSCNKCHLLSLRKVERPTLEQLIIDIKETNYVLTGKKYGVSDNSIRKWIKQYKRESIIN